MPSTITQSELVQQVLDKPQGPKDSPQYTLREKYATGKKVEEFDFSAGSELYLEYHHRARELPQETELKEDANTNLTQLFWVELKKSQVQRHPKQFGITGILLATAGVFAVAAAIMVGLELGAGVGVWAALTGAMPFLAALGAGVPALLALSAVFAAIVLVGYGIGVIATHFATRGHPVDGALAQASRVAANLYSHTLRPSNDEGKAPAPNEQVAAHYNELFRGKYERAQRLNRAISSTGLDDDAYNNTVFPTVPPRLS